MAVAATRVVIEGRVQGVAFRAATCEMATRLDLQGWVRNWTDGRVEAFFQGTPTDLAAALAWCGNGPPLARVLSLSPEPAAINPELVGFSIRSTVPPSS